MSCGRRAGLTLAGVAAGGLAWASLVERHLYTLREFELPVLRAGSQAIRVLQISDTHLVPGQRRRIEWIRSLASHSPDLILLTGDLMGHVRALPALREALFPFRGVPGIYVHGSNDYYGPILKNPLKYLQSPNRLSTRVPDIDTAALERMLSDELGFVNLNNSAVDLQVADGSTVRLMGLGDPHIRYDDPARMREHLANLPGDADPVVSLGVVHAPYREALDVLLREGNALLVAGHTHGGQLRVPGYGALTSNSDLPPSQSRGVSVWFDEDSAAFLHVSAGLGHSMYAPVRFACRPEASLITLVAEG